MTRALETAALKLLSRNKGAFKLLWKHLNQNEHISKVQCSPASRCPACEAHMSREKAVLCFLDRHASISQAKGIVNLPWKRAPLSKLLQPHQSVLCLHFLLMLTSAAVGNSFICVVWSCQSPSDYCHHEIACARFISTNKLSDWLSPCSPCASRYMHVNNFGPKRRRRVFEAVWQV